MSKHLHRTILRQKHILCITIKEQELKSLSGETFSLFPNGVSQQGICSGFAVRMTSCAISFSVNMCLYGRGCHQVKALWLFPLWLYSFFILFICYSIPTRKWLRVTCVTRIRDINLFFHSNKHRRPFTPRPFIVSPRCITASVPSLSPGPRWWSWLLTSSTAIPWAPSRGHNDTWAHQERVPWLRGGIPTGWLTTEKTQNSHDRTSSILPPDYSRSQKRKRLNFNWKNLIWPPGEDRQSFAAGALFILEDWRSLNYRLIVGHKDS